MSVWWDEEVNLPKHWKRRQSADSMCWSNLINHHADGILIPGSPVDQDSYRDWSHWTSDNCWYKYVAEQQRADGKWHPLSTYYVDEKLVKVVAKNSDEEITTCYHVHFSWLDDHALMNLPAGERQTLFLDKLQNEKESKTRRFREIGL